MKKVILNADDFCLSKVYNEVILSLIDEGAITSTTVMIDRYTDDQIDHVKQLLQKSNVGIGLHDELIDDQGVKEEIQRQYDKFAEIFGQSPDHLDMHKREDKSYEVLMQFCIDHSLPYRNSDIFCEGGKTTTYKRVSAIDNWTDQIMREIDSMNDEGSLEVVLHPGKYDPACKTSLNHERAVDVMKAKMLREYCSENDVVLINFGEL